MHRTLIAGFLLCLSATVSLAGGMWERHKLDDGRIEVLLPETPAYKPMDVNGVTMHRFTADAGATMLSVSRTELPDLGKDVPANVFFDGSQKGVIDYLDGTLVESKDIKLGRLPGREYLVAFTGLDGAPRLTRTRIYLDGLTSYQLSVNGPANAVRNDGVSAKFLDSFQLPKQKAAQAKIPQPNDAPANVAPQAAAMPLNLRFADRLKLGDELDTVRAQSFRKVFPVELKADQTYQIDMSSTEFDTYLRLEDNTGRQVAFNDDANGTLNSQIVFTPRQGGRYRVIATTYGGGATGAFTLTVAQRGAALVGGRFPAPPMPLPKNQDGVAHVVDRLNRGDALDRNFFYKVYTFPMTAGQTYRIDMKAAQQDGFDSYLFLEDPQGRPVAFNDDDPRFLTLDASILHTANKTGNYRIIATTFRAFATGPFELQVTPIGNGNVAIPLPKAAMPAKKAAPPVQGVWEVKGRDTKIWTATMVLRQPRVGVLEGHFDWRSAGGESGGREHFQGTFDPATGLVILQGVRLENARGIALGRCVAVMSADGREMREGVWGGPLAQSGIWSAVLQQPEQTQAAGAPAP